MSFDKFQFSEIKQMLNFYGVEEDSELLDNANFLLKMKYELMRYDVQEDLQQYFAKSFHDRVVLFTNSNSIIVPKVIMILSNKCSLACKNCSMLMPKFKTPWEISLGDALFYIDNFLRGTDEVLNFNLIGGEPLLYKDLPAVIDHLVRCEKVKQVSLFTNGTIVPDDRMLNSLKQKKVEIVVSDYGNLVQMAQLIDCLEKNYVRLGVRSNLEWIDFGDVHYREKKAETLRAEFKNCAFSDNCKALLYDKLFVCERAARMYMLGVDYDFSADCVELNQYSDDDEIRKRIQELFALTKAEACNHCDAGKPDAVIIPAGEQSGKEIYRSQYTIVAR